MKEESKTNALIPEEDYSPEFFDADQLRDLQVNPGLKMTFS